MKPKKVELSYDERELVLGALQVYEEYLRTGKAVCTYGKSPIAAKETATLEKKMRKIHFGKDKA